VKLFCFGLGYSARVLAKRLAARGWAIAGTSRTPAGPGDAGFSMHLFDGTRKMTDAAAALAGTTHLLLSVPPDAGGDPAFRHHADDIAALDLAWAGYLSTTGVYGDRGGGWVDEDSALNPSGERGRRRVEAEAGWQDLGRRRGTPIHIFRLAGIYGPGRSQLDTARNGTARRIDKPGQVFSRIHVEDIATVLEASMARPRPGAAYNLSDDDPAPPAEVTLHACRLLGRDPPPLVPFAEAEKEMSAMARSFWDDNRRVSNRRIKEELGVALRYPDYKSGLAAILAAESADAPP
jgi:nucleoside-diphosphate-sugar epimerase